jgi:hypothetical protein
MAHFRDAQIEDHRDLVDGARTDRRRLGHNVDDSAVLCVR